MTELFEWDTMGIEIIDKRKEEYRGHVIEVTTMVNFNTVRGRHTRIVKASVPTRGVCRLATFEDLDPSSLLPWRDPEPTSADEQRADTIEQMKARLDDYIETKEMAAQ